MKTAKKAILLVLCAALLVTASVMGTLAYLTAQSNAVTNAFTVGKVAITLDEALVDVYGNPGKENESDEFEKVENVADADRVNENTYKLIPGHTYTKDPTIRVTSGSEACWLFVKVENDNPNAAINGLDTNGWTQIDGTNYWAYKGATVGANSNVPVFDSFTYDSEVADSTADVDKKIVVTAYAIQADGFATSDLAWTALSNQLNLTDSTNP